MNFSSKIHKHRSRSVLAYLKAELINFWPLGGRHSPDKLSSYRVDQQTDTEQHYQPTGIDFGLPDEFKPNIQILLTQFTSPPTPNKNIWVFSR